MKKGSRTRESNPGPLALRSLNTHTMPRCLTLPWAAFSCLHRPVIDDVFGLRTISWFSRVVFCSIWCWYVSGLVRWKKDNSTSSTGALICVGETGYSCNTGHVVTVTPTPRCINWQCWFYLHWFAYPQCLSQYCQQMAAGWQTFCSIKKRFFE